MSFCNPVPPVNPRPVCEDGEKCDEILDSNCVVYTGPVLDSLNSTTDEKTQELFIIIDRIISEIQSDVEHLLENEGTLTLKSGGGLYFDNNELAVGGEISNQLSLFAVNSWNRKTVTNKFIIKNDGLSEPYLALVSDAVENDSEYRAEVSVGERSATISYSEFDDVNGRKRIHLAESSTTGDKGIIVSDTIDNVGFVYESESINYAQAKSNTNWIPNWGTVKMSLGEMILIDTVTGLQYKLVVTNGQLSAISTQN